MQKGNNTSEMQTLTDTQSLCVVPLPFPLAVISFTSAIAESPRAIMRLSGILSSALKHVEDAELLGGIQTSLNLAT